MTQKKLVGAGAVLVVGVGASIYLWSTVGLGADKGDKAVANKKETFTCKVCKNTFTMTVAEAGAMKRANKGQIICPSCNAAGAQKHDVVFNMGGDGAFKSDKEEEERPADAPAPKPKVKGGGAQKINP
jgi:hypothetical protein